MCISVRGYNDYGPLRADPVYSGRLSLFQVLRVKDGGRKFLQNVGILAPHHMVSHPNKLGLSSNYMFNIPTECTRTVEYIHTHTHTHIFYQISPTCFGAYCTILRALLSLAQNYLVILMLLHWLQSIRYMWVLQRDLQLTEQYLALCCILKVI